LALSEKVCGGGLITGCFLRDLDWLWEGDIYGFRWDEHFLED